MKARILNIFVPPFANLQLFPNWGAHEFKASLMFIHAICDTPTAYPHLIPS
jgi:hypothetical protein